MDDWLRNMDDWNISRQRYFGLPLPFYPCACGHLNVIGSLAELKERATAGLERLEELHRPWIDEVTIRCESCGGDVHRIPEVGDVWLDAGIVPFSTLGWRNPNAVAGGYATGASRGLSGADLPDHSYWERWFPAHWVSEMREQIRLWFYSLLFMSVVLEGRAPYRQVLSYEKLLDEHGRAMHGSLGQRDRRRRGVRPDGRRRDALDVLRAASEPEHPLRLRPRRGGQAQAAHDLELRARSSSPTPGSRASAPATTISPAAIASAELRPLDRWLLARTQELLADATRAYESFLTVGVIRAFEAFVDDLSNWYIRRSRRRFYEYDDAAFRTLWYALVQAVRVIGPVMPFLAEHLWQRLVAGPATDAPDSVFLAGWPEPLAALADEALVAEVADARQAIELGRAARQAAGVKLRQPLRRVVVCAPDPARAGRRSPARSRRSRAS